MINIVVAVDLGTSRSAGAFTMQGRADGDVIIRVPKGSDTSPSSYKTETAVLLTRENADFVSFGCDARKRFLHECEGISHPAAAKNMLFRWFKSALCEKRDYRHVLEPVAIAEGGQKRPLLHVTVAALRHFKDDILQHLVDVAGVPLSNDDIRWVITIPAIYDDFAKSFMRRAAFEAGIITEMDSSRLLLCLEPEAACLAVNAEDPSLHEPGTKLMILDCGGGTVDITTHEVLSVSPLSLKEILPPTGGPWGSMYVDEAFKDWLRDFLGRDRYELIHREASFFEMLHEWEDGKVSFSGRDDETLRLNFATIAGDLDMSQDDMEGMVAAFNQSYHQGSTSSKDDIIGRTKFKIRLPSSLVTSFFTPTIDLISRCLRDLKQNPALENLKHVVLVGGFSSSPLVQKATRDVMEGAGCTVTLANRPEVAIVKGAVMFADNAKVFGARKARLTYGVRCLRIYNRKNPEDVKRRTALLRGQDNRERIATFSRHIVAGDDIPADGACPVNNYAPVFESQATVDIQVLASNRRDIEYPDDGSYFRLGSLVVPLDMNVPIQDRDIDVQFNFGGTEVSVHCAHRISGKKVRHTVFSLNQEIQLR